MNALLKVNGQKYVGWKRMSLSESLEQVFKSFEFTMADRWPGQEINLPLRPGLACEVVLEGERVLTGYIDNAEPDIDAENHEVTISGRDKTQDLVDCSVIYKSGEWNNVTLAQLAKTVCEPFGITVVDIANANKVFKKVSLQTSETAFELLERLARQRAVLLNSDSAGNLLILRPEPTLYSTQLVEGENILSLSGRFSAQERYSLYVAKGQHFGDDNLNGENAASPSAKTTDSSLRYRPLEILAEDNATAASLQDRIQWEKAVRNARSSEIQVTVQGWKTGGSLWQTGRLIQVVCPSCDINEQLLISGVNFQQDEQGSRTTLTLTGKNAYNPEPATEEASDSLFNL